MRLHGHTVRDIKSFKDLVSDIRCKIICLLAGKMPVVLNAKIIGGVDFGTHKYYICQNTFFDMSKKSHAAILSGVGFKDAKEAAK